jgi:hypothetical protein
MGQQSYRRKGTSESAAETGGMTWSQIEKYQSFMAGYVRRINEATLNVTIGGVRIGTAKYTRLAQINLQTRIITFSKYAIENVPERGRRYLVIHELAHVKEPSHNKRFWGIVAQYEPDYKRIGREIQNAFSQNVNAELALQTGGGEFFCNGDDIDHWSTEDYGIISGGSDDGWDAE